jgi:hypothetical protein
MRAPQHAPLSIILGGVELILKRVNMPDIQRAPQPAHLSGSNPPSRVSIPL